MKWPTSENLRKLPETLAHRLEGYSPELAKRVLNYASQAVQPELLATLFDLEEWSDTRMGLSLRPGAASAGNLVSLSEFMVRRLLGRHLPIQDDEIRMKQVSLTLDTPFQSRVRMRLEISSEEREEWLRPSYREGRGQQELIVRLQSEQDQSLGEIKLRMEITPRPALPPGSKEG